MRSIIIAGAVFALTTSAQATVMVKATPSSSTVPGGLMSSYSGVTSITFDGTTALPPSFQGGAIVKGSVDGLYAAPNGDSSRYLIVGTGPTYTGAVVFTPGVVSDYFGLYWGSIDAYNSLTFLLNGQTVETLTGAQVSTATGNTAAAGTNEYVDVLFSAGTGYDTVVFSTPTPNFEIDNVAFGQVGTSVSVPEPATLAILALPMGLVGLMVAGRRQRVDVT